MYLLPRIFGVSLYSLLLIIFTILIYNSTSYNKNRKLLLIYLVLLCTMAFFFYPASGSDLYRIYDFMHFYANENAKNFYERLLNSTSPVSLLYLRYIGKIGIDNLLPMLTTLICYKSIFYILHDYSKKNNISGQAIALTLLSIMCANVYILCIGNIRTMLAFSIVARCIYDDYFNNKSVLKNIPLYVLASFIHNTSFVVTLIRAFTFLLNKKENKKGIINIIQKIIMIMIIILVFVYGKSIINSVSDKANDYITSGNYNYFWDNVIGWMVLLFLGRTVISKSEKNLFNKHFDFGRFVLIIILVILMFSFEHSIFTRFISFAQVICIPFILNRFDYIVRSNKNSNYKLISLYLFCILMISCIRGSMCSLKFWE